MGFTQRTAADGFEEITFLYRLERGLADASFGVWCARLAGLPTSILQRAQERADALKADTRERGVAAVGARLRALLDLTSGAGEGGDDEGGGKDGREWKEKEVARAARRLESALAFVRAAPPPEGSGTATPT